MYKVTVRDTHDGEVYCRLMEFPPTMGEQEEILEGWHMCYIDVCRLGYDGLSDSANFRHEVEVDLEPFSLEPFIEELLL